MSKIIELRILLEELGDINHQGWIELFVQTIKDYCSLMTYDPQTQCYKLWFKNEYWLKSLELCPELNKYFYKEEYNV